MTTIRLRAILPLLAALAIFPASTQAQEAKAEEKTQAIKAARGMLELQVPESWKRSSKRSTIIEYEFFAPADAKDAESRARITMMASGGTIKQNIERWYGQFQQPDGGSTKDRAKVKEFKADGQTVHWVDITGNFQERMGGGPFSGGKTVTRTDHRMLGAIIVAGRLQYFVKMTGPAKVCFFTCVAFLS